MNLQCTKKALKAFGIKNLDNIMVLNSEKDIDSWHCNVVEYGNIDFILITNDKTLFSFCFFNILEYKGEELSFVLREKIFKMLLNSGFPQNQFEVVLKNIEKIKYTNSSNRGVIGTMNQIVKVIEYELYERNKSELDINIKINSMIHKKIEYKKPNELFSELLLSK